MAQQERVPGNEQEKHGAREKAEFEARVRALEPTLRYEQFIAEQKNILNALADFREQHPSHKQWAYVLRDQIYVRSMESAEAYAEELGLGLPGRGIIALAEWKRSGRLMG